MLLLRKACLLFKLGDQPHNTIVTQMAHPWAGIGSVLLNTHSVEHHDGAAISLTTRDGVPNYHNDNTFTLMPFGCGNDKHFYTFTSMPFGCGNDKHFFLLFCEQQPLIGRCWVRSQNMLRPPTKCYYHCKRKVAVSDIGGSDIGMPPRKKHHIHEPPSIPSISSCSTCRCALWKLRSCPLLCRCPKPGTQVERQHLAVSNNEWSTAMSCHHKTAGN